MIHDRLVFAATSFKPLVMLRDAWMSKASGWHSQMRQAKDAYDKEMERAKAAAGKKRSQILFVARPRCVVASHVRSNRELGLFPTR